MTSSTRQIATVQPPPPSRTPFFWGVGIATTALMAIVVAAVTSGGPEPRRERPPPVQAAPTPKVQGVEGRAEKPVPPPDRPRPPVIENKTVQAFIAPAIAGLVGHWKLDEASGTVAADASPRGAAARVVGTPKWTPGKIGGGLRLDGVADYVEMPNVAHLATVQRGSYTLCIRFMPEDIPPANSAKNNTRYALFMRQGQHLGLSYAAPQCFVMDHWLHPGEKVQAIGTKPYPPGRFYFVAGTVDLAAGLVKLYVDGHLETTARFAPNAKARDFGALRWKIGGGNLPSQTWAWLAKGVVDDVRIYSRALTPAEIEALSKEGGK